jgi:hypothetical protein
MSAQSLDLQSIVQAQTNERIKIAKAVEIANKAAEEAKSTNALMASVANDLVSKIQADLQKKLRDTRKAAEEAYEKEMVALGLSSKVYPLETALLAADQKVLTPALENVGKVGGVVANVGVGVFNRMKNGFKKARQ